MTSLSPSSSSSSSSSLINKHDVFMSFYGQDVRKRLLSHIHQHFKSHTITVFKDQEIERGHHIKPELFKAIKESRVSMVVLSKNYASSSWCLDELVEILKCEEDSGQTVMTIFYDVDPTDVRKQNGDFGIAFEKTCEGKTEEVKQRWTKALIDVANIEGEHFLNWHNEADMIQKITTDVLYKLNFTHSSKFDGHMGHLYALEKLQSLLCLDECPNDVRMIGIQGCVGVGKTSLAEALYEELSTRFELKCFMGDLKGTCKTSRGCENSKLYMESKLLSEIFNEKDMKVCHLGTIKERLHDQRVLIILDDVDHIKQLQTLAKKHTWFGPGSLIIVITEGKKILKAHGIHDIYHMSARTNILDSVKGWSRHLLASAFCDD